MFKNGDQTNRNFSCAIYNCRDRNLLYNRTGIMAHNSGSYTLPDTSHLK